MKIIFLGTPEFSLLYLQALLGAGYEIVGVVTQPDSPQGRHLKLQPSPVKKMAKELKLPLFQPQNLEDKTFQQALKKIPLDLGVVVAYGKIVPTWLLELPKYGVVNVHPSLLPLYRGAAPIQRAIMDGEKKTGLTIQLMDEGLDTGDILSQEAIVIGKDDTTATLENKLSKLGPSLLLSVMKNWVEGKIKPIKQDEKRASYAPKIKKEECQILWKKPAAEIKNLIRALNPEPGAYTFFRGKRLKVWEAKIVWSPAYAPSSEAELLRRTDKASVADAPELWRRSAGKRESVVGSQNKAGTILDIKEGLVVATGTEPLELDLVQPENRNKIRGVEFTRGYRPNSRERLGR